MLRTRHGLRPLSLRERHGPAARNRSVAPRGVPQGGTHALRAPRSEAAYGCAASTSRCAIRSTRVHSPERSMHCVKWAGASSHGTPTHRPRHDQAQRETTLRPSRIAAPIVALAMSPCSAQRRVTATSTHRTPPPHPASTISPCRRAAPRIAPDHREHTENPLRARDPAARSGARIAESTPWSRHVEHRPASTVVASRAPPSTAAVAQRERVENASSTTRGEAPQGANRPTGQGAPRRTSASEDDDGASRPGRESERPLVIALGLVVAARGCRPCPVASRLLGVAVRRLSALARGRVSAWTTCCSSWGRQWGRGWREW